MERAINGHPTWIDDRGGDGPPVLVLHGGLSDSSAMGAIVDAVAAAGHRVVAFDRRGHGRTRDTDAPFHYGDMAVETVAVLEDVVGGAAHLIGWSDGGIISLLVALDRPDLVRSMVLIGANFHFDGVQPAALEGGDGGAMEMIRAAYAAVSPDGEAHFGVVAEKTFAMFASEPTLAAADIAAIDCPALVLVGDDDLIHLAHTCDLYEALPNGQLAVVPGASHLVVLERSAIVNQLIGEFLAGAAEGAPVETLMPIRRASS